MKFVLHICAALAVFAGAAAAGRISADDLDALPRPDVIILGEIHDNPIHHRNQARAVAALKPAALVFEMLTPEKATKATPDLRGDKAGLSEALGWADSGWPDFSYYYPIFAAAPQAKIFGGDLPRGQVRRAVKEGAAAVFGAEAGRYGLDMPLPDAMQATREEGQMEAHCNALPPDLLPGMVQAQRLRDAALARAVVMAMTATGGPVAVITGDGHARKDWGVPFVLDRVAPELSVITIGQYEKVPDGNPPYDFWIVTAPAEREDPCAGFTTN